MPRPKTSTLTLLASLLLTLAACTTQPQSAATPTPTTTPSAATTSTPTLTPTPSPTPTRENLGPEGTAIARDGKVWLVCKDGNYTIDIPENYSPVTFEEEDLQKTILQSGVSAGLDIRFTPRLDMPEVPTRDDIASHLAGSGGLEPQIRDDLTEFAGSPAVTAQFKKLRPSWETDPNYDGTILTTFTEIGDTRWVIGVIASTRQEAETQRTQIATTLKKQ